jgi:hypothetical protein
MIVMLLFRGRWAGPAGIAASGADAMLAAVMRK